jgi:hypothetical protein
MTTRPAPVVAFIATHVPEACAESDGHAGTPCLRCRHEYAPVELLPPSLTHDASPAAQHCFFLPRRKFTLNLMKSAGILRFDKFCVNLGATFRNRWCGSTAPKVLESLSMPPKRPVRHSAGSYFRSDGEDALRKRHAMFTCEFVVALAVVLSSLCCSAPRSLFETMAQSVSLRLTVIRYSSPFIHGRFVIGKMVQSR